jgi:AcrR family transcriptional regulator
MRRLGARLGVDPMAVHHYVPSKAALLDGVVELLRSKVHLEEVDLSADWRAALVSRFPDLASAFDGWSHDPDAQRELGLTAMLTGRPGPDTSG